MLTIRSGEKVARAPGRDVGGKNVGFAPVLGYRVKL